MTCEACASVSLGLYRFDCRRCEARSYVRAPELHQREARRRWAKLSETEIAEMQQLVADERAKEEKVA